MNRVFSVLSAGGIHVDKSATDHFFGIHPPSHDLFLITNPKLVPNYCPWRSSSISYGTYGDVWGVSPLTPRHFPLRKLTKNHRHRPSRLEPLEPRRWNVWHCWRERKMEALGRVNFWELMDANKNSSTAVGGTNPVLYIPGGLPDFWTINSIIKLRVCQ